MAFEPIETQEAFDAAIKTRLERERRKVEGEIEAKYADYGELAEKAKAYDEAREAEKSELEKANERIAALEGEKAKREEADKAAALRRKVASEKGVPEDLISGSDEEAMGASADRLLEFAKEKRPSGAQDPSAGSFRRGSSGDGGEKAYVRQLLGSR